MIAQKAVIFTHLGISMEAKKGTYTATDARNLINRVLPYFKAYLRCKNIGLVYVYVDIGVQLVLSHLSKSRSSSVLKWKIDELEFEQNTRNCLKLAVDQAADELSRDGGIPFQRSETPQFQFIGLPHLLTLIHSLHRIDDKLIKSLAGTGKGGTGSVFTYDSPKFVEAVVRLARGASPAHSHYPIFRIDADVEVNELAIAILLNQAGAAMQSQLQPYSFFSGGYGKYDGDLDPVNDFAVRLHWLVDRDSLELSEPALTFLGDLSEIGACQIPGEPISTAMSNFITKARKGITTGRKSQQVISGAGLYISRAAICILPPFMNFGKNVIWIDDHLKRRLLEVLGYISKDDIEHDHTALFGQTRHRPTDEWTKNTYFDRLLLGCVMHSLITTPEGHPGRLAEEVQNIILTQGPPATKTALKTELTNIAEGSAKQILGIWHHANYYGTTILREWMDTRQTSGKLTKDAKNLITNLVSDAVAYLDLLSQWHHYVQAIEQLTPVDDYWLFRHVREDSYVQAIEQLTPVDDYLLFRHAREDS